MLSSMRLMTIICTFFMGCAALAQSNVELSETEIELGVIEQGAVVEVPLSVRNTGDGPITVEKIQFSCHCLAAENLGEDGLRIDPGEERKLPISYDTMDYTGEREATIMVTVHDPERQLLQAKVKTTIVSPVVMTPRALRWGPQIRGASLESDIDLKPGYEGSDLELLRIAVPHPDLEFNYETKDQNGGITLGATFTLNPTAQLGSLNTILEAQVRLDDREFPVRIPVSLHVLGDAMIRPPQIVSVSRPSAPGERISSVKLIQTIPDMPIKILDVSTRGPIRAERKKGIDAQGSEVEIYVADIAPPGPNAAEILVYSTSEDFPVSIVPVYFVAAAPISLEPTSLALHTTTRSASATASIRKRVPSAEIVDVRCDLKDVSVRISDKADNAEATLHAEYSGPEGNLPLTGSIAIELKDNTIVSVPIVVHRTPR